MCAHPTGPRGVTSDRGACRFALPVRAPARWAVAFSFPAAAVCQEGGWLVSRGTSRGPMVWISFLTFMSRDARRVPGRRGRAGARATVGTEGRRVRCLVCDRCALGSDPRCSRRKLSIIYGKWTEGLWGIDPAAYESFRKQERRGELPGPARPVRRSSARAPGLGGGAARVPSRGRGVPSGPAPVRAAARPGAGLTVASACVPTAEAPALTAGLGVSWVTVPVPPAWLLGASASSWRPCVQRLLRPPAPCAVPAGLGPAEQLVGVPSAGPL